MPRKSEKNEAGLCGDWLHDTDQMAAATRANTAPALRHIDCAGAPALPRYRRGAGQHRLAYWEWNNTGNPAHPHVIVCVHGLSRQGRDFDVLAHALSSRARVICPDMPGRGESDWLAQPLDYAVPLYAQDIRALLWWLHSESRIETLDWVGTSMGGLIGLSICGQPQVPIPIAVSNLVLNDVGPVLEWPALARIGAYIGQSPRFATVQKACEALASVASGFGPHSAVQWEALTAPMLKADGDGYRLHYDPAIAIAFQALARDDLPASERTLWDLYDHVTARTLLLRGADSDLLSRVTAEEMTRRGPRALIREFAGVGHAPTMVAADQVRVVLEFLFGDPGLVKDLVL